MDFKKLIKDQDFIQFLRKLGGSHDRDEIIPAYWTSTRWKVEKIGKSYILSPAFYQDDSLELRFAMGIEKGKFQLKLFAERDRGMKILDTITCFKIVIEYVEDEKIGVQRVELTPFEELFVSISNLDAYFQEEIPVYEAWDLNIVNQAFDIAIERGVATEEIRDRKCKEIIEKIITLSEEQDLYRAQLYIQIKSLLDYWDFSWWFYEVNKHIDLIGFLHEIALTEQSEELEHKIATIAEKNTDEKLLDQLIFEMHDPDSPSKNRIFWFVNCIKNQKNRRSLENLLITRLDLEPEDEQTSKNMIELLLEIGHLESKLLLFDKFSRLDLSTRLLILENIELNLDLRHVPFLMQLLKDTNWQVRLKTFEILGLIGDNKVVEPLTMFLDDPHPKVRAQVAELLGQFRNPLAIKPLVFRLKEEDKSSVQSRILEALEDISMQAAAFPLIVVFRTKNLDAGIQAQLIEVLGRLGGPKVVEFLNELLSTKEKSTLLACLEAAKYLREEEISPQIYSNLEHPDPEIRKKVLEVIRFFPSADELSNVIARLTDVKPVQLEAIQTLGFLRSPKIFFNLVTMLRSPDDDVVFETIVALGRLKDKRAISPLLNIQDGKYRNQILVALSKFVDNKTIAALMKRLTNPDWKIRLSVVRTIGGFKDSDAKPALIFSLWDPNVEVRKLAGQIMRKYKQIKYME